MSESETRSASWTARAAAIDTYKSVLCSLMCSTDSYLRKYDNVLSCTCCLLVRIGALNMTGSEGLPTVNAVTVTGAYTLGQPCGSMPAPATHTLSSCLTDRARDPGPAVTYRAIFRVRRVLAWHTHTCTMIGRRLFFLFFFFSSFLPSIPFQRYSLNPDRLIPKESKFVVTSFLENSNVPSRILR